MPGHFRVRFHLEIPRLSGPEATQNFDWRASHQAEFDAPEPRARREKFNSNTHTLVEESQGDNSTCLLFFGGKIGEDNIYADFHRLVQEKQTAMRVYHDRFGVLAEFLAVGVLA